MRIGIDCRMYGLKHAGIGRYVMNLVEELLKQDKENEYVLFARKDFWDQVQSSKFKVQSCSSKLKVVEADMSHYSLKEQILLPGIVAREKVDLMHFPHFNVPVFYRGKYLVTIHDLIKHTSKGMTTTTRSPLLYWLKFLGYKIVFRQAVKRAEEIITPSQFVRGELVKQYGITRDKITVTYEGVSDSIKNQVLSIKGNNGKVLEKYNIKTPFLLYVGSIYPHKNIERLIEAVEILNQSLTTNHQPQVTLVVVCARNVFSERLRNKVVQIGAQDFVNLAGFVPDDDLSVLYQEAESFVFPTLSEGFGLPGLEAMAVDCPVICSNIPVLKEVYQEAAEYFNPLDVRDIAEKIKLVVGHEERRENMVKMGFGQVKKYSWEKMAKETLSIYQSF